MAISNPVSMGAAVEQTSGTAASITTGSITAVTGRMIVVLAQYRSTANPGTNVPTISTSGMTVTWQSPIYRFNNNSQGIGVVIYVGVVSSGGTGTITINWHGSAGTVDASRGRIQAFEIASGFDSSSPILSSNTTDTGGATSVSFAMTATTTGLGITTCAIRVVASSTPTADSEWTLISSGQVGGTGFDWLSQYNNGAMDDEGGGLHVVQTSWTGSNRAAMAGVVIAVGPLTATVTDNEGLLDAESEAMGRTLTDTLPVFDANSRQEIVNVDDSTFEGGTIGNWANIFGTGIAFSNSTAQPYRGTRSLLLTFSAGGSGILSMGSSAGFITPTVAPIVGRRVLMRLFVKAMSRPVDVAAAPLFYTSGNALVSALIGSTVTVTPAMGWTMVETLQIVPATATKIAPGFTIGLSGTPTQAGDLVYVDEMRMWVEPVLLTTLTRTLTEQLGLLDAESESMGRTFTDLEGLLDAESETLTRPITDALGLLDSWTVGASIAALVSDVLGLLDSWAASQARTITDNEGLEDDETPSAVATVTLGDLLGLSDAIAARDQARSIGDLLGLTDPLASTFTSDILITDLLGLTDEAIGGLIAAGCAVIVLSADRATVTLAADRATVSLVEC